MKRLMASILLSTSTGSFDEFRQGVFLQIKSGVGQIIFRFLSVKDLAPSLYLDSKTKNSHSSVKSEGENYSV